MLLAAEVNVWVAVAPTVVTVIGGGVFAYLQNRQKQRTELRRIESQEREATVAAAAVKAAGSLNEVGVVIKAWQDMTVVQSQEIGGLRGRIETMEQRENECQQERTELLEKLEGMTGILAGLKIWGDEPPPPIRKGDLK